MSTRQVAMQMTQRQKALVGVYKAGHKLVLADILPQDVQKLCVSCTWRPCKPFFDA